MRWPWQPPKEFEELAQIAESMIQDLRRRSAGSRIEAQKLDRALEDRDA